MMLHYLIYSFIPFSNCFFYCLFLFLYLFLLRILTGLFFFLLEMLKIGSTYFCIHITIIICGPKNFQRFIEICFCFCIRPYFYFSSSRSSYITKKFFQSGFFFIQSSFSGLFSFSLVCWCVVFKNKKEKKKGKKKTTPPPLLFFFLKIFFFFYFFSTQNN